MVNRPFSSVCVAVVVPFTWTVTLPKAESPDTTLPCTCVFWANRLPERNANMTSSVKRKLKKARGERQMGGAHCGKQTFIAINLFEVFNAIVCAIGSKSSKMLK